MSKIKDDFICNLKYMFNLAKKINKTVIIFCLALAGLMTIKTVIELVITPVFLQQLEISARLKQLMIIIVSMIVLLYGVSGAIAYLKTNTLFGRIAIRMHLIQAIGRKVANTSYSNLLDTKFINLESQAYRICSCNSSSSEAIWETITNTINKFICLLVYLFIISYLNVKMILMVVITATVSELVHFKVNRWRYHQRDQEAKFQKQLDYLKQITTNRQYGKDIRIFKMTGWLDELWQGVIDLYQAFITKCQCRYLLFHFVDVLMILLRNGIAYSYLIYLVIHGNITVSLFLLYFNALSGFTEIIVGLFQDLTLLHRQCLDIAMIQELLNWPETFLFDEGKELEKASDYEIKLENVSYRYPEAKENTIDHLNLTIHPGEKLAIVGLNGAGKTTLVKLICGLLDPSEGRVLLNGQDIKQFNRQQYYRLFSAVFQDWSLLEASVRENVAQQVEQIDDQQVLKCLQAAGLKEKILSLPQQLDTKLGRLIYEDGIELSGGQIQRLMLARALYKNGPIVVLDEPTAALDPLAENDIYLKYSQITDGRTSLFISHRLASTQFCHRIILLEKGHIIESGTHLELLRQQGTYASMFKIQSQYYQEGVETIGKE